MFNKELEFNGFSDGDAFVKFQTHEEDLDTNYLETSNEHGEVNTTVAQPRNIDGSTALTTDPDPYETHKNKSKV